MSRKKKPGIKSLGWTENCIFCGNPADSEEDAHPKWLIEWLKDNMHIDPNDPNANNPPILERQITVGGEVQAPRIRDLEHWSSDRELNGVRDENELDELPGLERKRQ